MVGGLIEQQQIRVADQSSSQQHATLVATGEAGNIHISIEIHLGNNGFHTLVDIPAIDAIQFCLTGFQIAHGLIAGVIAQFQNKMVVALCQLAFGSQPLSNNIKHRALGVLGHRLLKLGNFDPGGAL